MLNILLLALGLRLISLNQSLWLDEALQYKASYLFSLKDMLAVYLPGDFNPPLSYIINHFLGYMLGSSEIALRLPSVIFGVLTVWLVYKLGGKWPALLLATSGLHIYYSQEARMYSLAALAVTASFYFLKQKKWLGYTLTSLAAIYSHYLTVFIFPAQLLLVKKSELKKLLMSWLAVAVGYLPWLPIFWQQLKVGETAAGTAWGSVVGGFSLKNIALIPVKFLIGRISIDNNTLFAAVMALPLVITAWLIFRGLKKNKFYSAWLFVPALLIVVLSVKLPVLSYFRLLFLLPAFYILIAKSASRKTLIGLLIFNLITSGVYLFNPKFHREDWRGAARSLTDLPVVITPAVDAPLRYYYAGDIRGTDQVPEQNFWYVAYAEDIFDPERSFRREAQAAGFREVGRQDFRGNITLIEYNQ